MFINLTNHPSSGWGKEQLEAALKFGEVVDLSFPNIEPSFTFEEIQDLADSVVAGILKFGEKPVVHVMGEMTFTYAVVFRLKALGIKCVASTTERNTVITPDGEKVSLFKFVQFRYY